MCTVIIVQPALLENTIKDWSYMDKIYGLASALATLVLLMKKPQSQKLVAEKGTGTQQNGSKSLYLRAIIIDLC